MTRQPKPAAVVAQTYAAHTSTWKHNSRLHEAQDRSGFTCLVIAKTCMDSFIEQHLQECGELTDTDTTVVPLSWEAAILFANRKQAFERLSIRWFEEVLAGWHFPQWVQRSFTALVENRLITAANRMGAIRRLSKSIGIGGTASPLSWGMAYDPIVEGMFRALGVEAPPYVDDLAGLINGPAQAMRACYTRDPD